MHYTRSKDAIQLDAIRRLQGDLAHKWTGFKNDRGAPLLCPIRSQIKPAFQKNFDDHILALIEIADDSIRLQSAKIQKSAIDQLINSSDVDVYLPDFFRSYPAAKHDPSDRAPASTSSDPLPLPATSEPTVAYLDPSEDDFELGFYVVMDDRVDTKWHVPGVRDPDRVACNIHSLLIKDMIPCGPDPPDAADLICKRCLKARPEILSLTI